METLVQHALPLAGIMLPMIISMRLEFVRRRKLLFAGIALGLNIILIAFLLYIGASMPEVLLMLLLSLLIGVA